MKTKKPIKILLIALSLLIIATIAGFFVCTAQYYKADDTAIAAINLSDSITYGDNYIAIGSPEQTDRALIFYPGGKVEYLAYYPLLERLSQNGITCILVKMPFNLAVFDLNTADEIMRDFPEIAHWYIGGHSLGGAMASSYASKHQEEVEGLILLGAYVYGEYPKDKALTLYGEHDGVLNRSKVDYTENVVVIDDGNHAQFGNYGHQKGDGDATITADEQQRITVKNIVEFINN